jgi:hypothetical protein
VPSPSFCLCTSGTWDCAPPEAGTVTCPSPAADGDLYVDPACTMAYGSVPDEDAGAQAGGCTPVLAADYDQSCVVDSDCVAVGQVPSCPVNACDGCTTEAVNKSAATQYMTAFTQLCRASPPLKDAVAHAKAVRSAERANARRRFARPPLPTRSPPAPTRGAGARIRRTPPATGWGRPMRARMTTSFAASTESVPMSRPRSSSHFRSRATVAFVAAGALRCSTSSGGVANQSGPCDPLAPPPTALGTLLAVGEDNSATLYVADEPPDGGGQDRVFVSNGPTLVRQHVAGGGQSGSLPNADFTFSFQPPFADAGDLRALLIQVQGGAVTGMALGPGNSRSFLGSADAGQVPLMVPDGGAVAGFAIQNLPNVVQYVVDVSNGEVVVITAPMDPSGYSGFRFFYGTANNMIERPITAYDQSLSGPADIAFTVGPATYTLHTTFAFGPDAGPLGMPASATLDTSSGTLSGTVVTPTPTSLSGFSFTCSTAAGG